MKHSPLLKSAAIITFILVCLSLRLTSQTIKIQKSFGGTKDDMAFSVREQADGNYVLFGWTKSFGKLTPTDANFYLLQIKPNGDSVRGKNYHAGASELGLSMEITKEKGYILAGNYMVNFRSSYLLIKIKPNLDTAWTKKYVSPWKHSDNTFTSVKQTADKGYILAGYCNGFDTTNTDIWLIKTDSMGDTLWTKHYGGAFNDEAWSVINTSDGGFAILGSTFSYGKNSGSYSDVYLLKTKSNGDTLWTRHYGGSYNDFGSEIVETSDQGFIIAASSASFGKGMSDVWLIKTNQSGDTTWTKTFGTASEDQGRFVRPYNGGYVVGGMSYGTGTGNSDGYIIFTNSTGSLLKTITAGGPNLDEFWGAEITKANDLLVVGNTQSMGFGFNDIYFVKINDGSGFENLNLKQNSVQVYPNPVHGDIHFIFNDLKDNNILLQIYDINGRLKISKQAQTGSNLVIPSGGLLPGIYYYRIENEEGKLSSGKIFIE